MPVSPTTCVRLFGQHSGRCARAIEAGLPRLCNASCRPVGEVVNMKNDSQSGVASLNARHARRVIVPSGGAACRRFLASCRGRNILQQIHHRPEMRLPDTDLNSAFEARRVLPRWALLRPMAVRVLPGYDQPPHIARCSPGTSCHAVAKLWRTARHDFFCGARSMPPAIAGISRSRTWPAAWITNRRRR